ncbi:hypothetical protein [Kitasatospora sp. GAS1066B]|uniref:hypothetical protein n=1 Tax=Kitasatospora sp. GAS1066B TaxID=3156271 RepID=UPI003516C5DE
MEPVWAASYDSDALGFDEELTADALHHLAAGGRRPRARARVDTGRIALPLARRGTRVLGPDASPKMTERPLSRRGPAQVRIADMTAFTVHELYPPSYTVASTFLLLPPGTAARLPGLLREGPHRRWPADG